jgi:hypothetical protein
MKLYQKIQNKHFLALPFNYSLVIMLQRRQFTYQGRFYLIPIIQLLNKTRTERLITFLSW